MWLQLEPCCFKTLREHSVAVECREPGEDIHQFLLVPGTWKTIQACVEGYWNLTDFFQFLKSLGNFWKFWLIYLNFIQFYKDSDQIYQDSDIYLKILALVYNLETEKWIEGYSRMTIWYIEDNLRHRRISSPV